MDTVRVLVVDDQLVYRDAVRSVLEASEGFELAATAESGEEGVSLSADLRPDLVLMDIKLPGIDGLDATRQIVSSNPDTEVIVFSTYRAEEWERRAREAGAIGFIAKADLAPDVLQDVWARGQ